MSVDQTNTRRAIRLAFSTRRRAGYSLHQAICIYDCAERLGVEVRFLQVPSFEGMYASSGSGLIVVSSMRPPGRQTYTCAHELGHHILGHGSKWDEYLNDWGTSNPRDPNEREAERFAGYLLMPRRAVMAAFAQRAWDPLSCTPEQAYTVAYQLGVGYSTLINQMCWSFGILCPFGKHA